MSHYDDPDEKLTAAELFKRTLVTDLYVRIGQLLRENTELRASLRLREIEIARLNAHVALGHLADCPGCPLCISYTPSPVATREDLDTSPDGRR